MTLDAHVTGIWCGQIGGGVGRASDWMFPELTRDCPSFVFESWTTHLQGCLKSWARKNALVLDGSQRTQTTQNCETIKLLI